MQPAQISLTHEEVLYLLNVMRIPSLPGMSPNPLGDLTNEQIQIMLSAGERSLLSKGLLKIEGNSLVLESVLIAVFGFCATDRRSLSMSRTTAAGTKSAIYHLSDPLQVKHDVDYGVHNFTLLRGEEDVVEDVMALLMGDAASNTPFEPMGFQLSGGALLLTRLAGQAELANENELRARLEASKLDEAQAAALLNSLQGSFVASASFGRLYAPPNPEENLSIGLIQDQTGWWVVLPSEIAQTSAQSTYWLERTNSDGLRAYVRDVLTPYMAIKSADVVHG